MYPWGFFKLEPFAPSVPPGTVKAYDNRATVHNMCKLSIKKRHAECPKGGDLPVLPSFEAQIQADWLKSAAGWILPGSHRAQKYQVQHYWQALYLAASDPKV